MGVVKKNWTHHEFNNWKYPIALEDGTWCVKLTHVRTCCRTTTIDLGNGF